MPTDNGPKRDVSPEKVSNPDKKKGESFNTAANKPNTPSMKRAPDMSYNVTDDYCMDNDD